MEASSFRDGSSVTSSPLSSPNISTLLKIKVLSWSQETGLPASLRVRVRDKSFNLHRNPLFLKSGYFKKREDQISEIELAPDFPGGPEIFEMITLFIYGCPFFIDPFNVAALRCAAEFLDLKEDQKAGNLCERFDLYLNQVVLQNWDDTILVLMKCRDLLPWSEDLLIVSRCIESLAFMACMEILDPERRREKPVVMLEGFENQPWRYRAAEKIIGQDIWIRDLIDLPFGFFKRVIGSLRRQGMKEKYVSPLVVFYANKWVISEDSNDLTTYQVSDVLQGTLDLLLAKEKTCRAVPVGFYFACLSKLLKLGLSCKTVSKLQDHIVSHLHTAHVEDFLYPETRRGQVAFDQELPTMESIFSKYISSHTDSDITPSISNWKVAKLWDIYLSRVANDAEMEPTRFTELVETVPMSFRQSHDQLYRAVNAFLQVHRGISHDEKSSVCSYLSCQKLSQEASIEVVQNELMPLRLIVKALFVQQLNTHQAFKECSDSFRFINNGDFSGSLPRSKPLNCNESPCTDEAIMPRSRPLGLLMRKDATIEEYESTSFRIQNLEHQLISLKKSLQSHNDLERTEPKVQRVKPLGLEKRSLSKNRNSFGEVTGCIGSVTFTSQRKYANRLLRVLRQVTLFGSRRSKRKAGE
ncbi:PREDICTED: BTB/POZ domain-containing protein At5g48130 [Tarenaya hassleriana]|uniref:BTB/POZ domain-containing protein At5g48130 n=1 Tax=Tarenaya hassleriana TaxID=28532 RepID=UPI00053C0BC7|nr:PREDICTED: BTB/POZ domain-containing protein At5g48130 [Tarenaya hassleriana]